MWVTLAICSALSLGVYDISRKRSLENNAVLPVLFFSTITGAILFSPFILISAFSPSILSGTMFFVPYSGASVHVFIFVKSCIVVISWILTFFAIKHLPLTIVSPIRSTAPVWTLIGALTFFGERLSTTQWVGLVISLIFFYLFTLSGHKEGFSLRNNKWLWFMIGGTFLGAISALYDKFLIKRFDKMEVQAWFSVYQVIILAPILLLLWYPQRRSSTPFVWKWNIPFIAVFLVVADFAYFWALSIPGALITIISTVRRSNVIVSFTAGVFLFKEKNVRAKALLLGGILVGIAVMYIGT